MFKTIPSLVVVAAVFILHGACGPIQGPSASSPPAVSADGQVRTARGNRGRTYTFSKFIHPVMGESWRDPSGRAWSGRNWGDNSQFRAFTHCLSMGTALPTRYDFEHLGVYMGASFADTNGNNEFDEGETYYGAGYRPQVLPELRLDGVDLLPSLGFDPFFRAAGPPQIGPFLDLEPLLAQPEEVSGIRLWTATLMDYNPAHANYFAGRTGVIGSDHREVHAPFICVSY